ncbi:CheR family methyltransferase [Planctomicrobium piriforme]|uniref:Chemotaxis protein methyltransferase WspC n=1 Tax=Planctomicrobium piriforme TaxID=1576369 RepID=A0A1I3HRS7_9PLAN|nr:CheR family methyltransferase [Planctomicrobium piriforme]SFI38372.1 chemotaxis protein methyltransferase WspC [Planctomicrobium piriforme]
MDHLPPATLERIQRLLQARLGSDPQVYGPQSLEQAARSRRIATHSPSWDAYEVCLHDQEAEQQALVEEMIVPETWFFRDGQPFRNLRLQSQSHGWSGPNTDTIRVLSVPCSTGEEAYSIAMILYDMGLREHRFHVDGIDVSQRSLERARRGEYSNYSCRERDVEFIELQQRYLRNVNEKWRVVDEIRPFVTFQQGNLIDPLFLAGEAPYQIIFCRNLFIYLERQARQLALKNLKRLLAADGVLYVGHSEAQAFLGADFETCDQRYPFALQQTQSVAASTALAPIENSLVAAAASLLALPGFALPIVQNLQNIVRVVPQLPTLSNSGGVNDNNLKNTSLVTASPAPQIESLLREAQAAADSGRLQTAAELCDELARRYPMSAAVSQLNGIVLRALGNYEKSILELERAIYLEPDQTESLTHLMQIHQLLGDEVRSEAVRRRLSRVTRRNEQRSN